MKTQKLICWKTSAQIFEELCQFQNENLQFVNVSHFPTKKAVTNGFPTFLIQISHESKINELKAINGDLYRCVHWETLRKPEIPQCRKCQSFFHSASNCFFTTKMCKMQRNPRNWKVCLKFSTGKWRFHRMKTTITQCIWP